MSEKKDLSPEKEQLPQSPLIPLLPDDVTVEIVARVPRSCYPTISLVSKGFKKLVASPELHKRRSLLGCNEHRLYAVLRNRSTGDLRIYVLHRKLNSSNRLVMVRSLPLMSDFASYVPVGSKIYALNDDLDAFSIDCGSHTVQPTSNLPQCMSSKVANMVGGKIYVIGHVFFRVVEEGGGWWKVGTKAVSVFDTETQMWEPVTIKQDMFGGALWCEAVVMEDKIYMKGHPESVSSVYRPKDTEWESDEMLNSKDWMHACVVDDVLYYHDLSAMLLRAYDPKQKRWSVVYGLEAFLAVEPAHSRWSDMVDYGAKKLALFFPKYHDAKETICCAEIALERRQG